MARLFGPTIAIARSNRGQLPPDSIESGGHDSMFASAFSPKQPLAIGDRENRPIARGNFGSRSESQPWKVLEFKG
ncbi:hypothetical protein V0288_23515 [Pannus brasiliensis CCIBt3594]|uniref:Uncharacterized protein n=1 Tax=Pannus brasiliensis CCIBt3594 TaxID=1427578 RepID=A0AAW9R0Q7_9CHRO